MRRRRFILITTVAGILVMGLSPWCLNWLVTGGVDAKFSVHYLTGCGRIVGAFGASDLRAKLYNKADMIQRDLVAIEFEYSGTEEFFALREFMEETWDEYSNYSSFGALDEHTMIMVIERGQEEEYATRLIEYRDTFRRKNQPNKSE